ncbi:unnamed protein product [Lasius platythorax]|uniref:Uncharacterized protein n=1 Tax=Lasius platythorax TaxID=488582 RepID=A0AAV2P1V1_9HYME
MIQARRWIVVGFQESDDDPSVKSLTSLIGRECGVWCHVKKPFFFRKRTRPTLTGFSSPSPSQPRGTRAPKDWTRTRHSTKDILRAQMLNCLFGVVITYFP